MFVTVVIVPCVVVPVVDSDGVAEAGESSVQLLRQNKLVTQQSVGVGKAWVHLRDRQVTERERQVQTCGQIYEQASSASRTPKAKQA